MMEVSEENTLEAWGTMMGLDGTVQLLTQYSPTATSGPVADDVTQFKIGDYRS